jgi:hypothetical protein
LELADGDVGLPPEDAVATAWVEAHVQEALLENRDVVADAGMAGDEREQPVAQSPMRFVERAIGLGADDAVDAQPPALLERADCAVDGVIELVTADSGQQGEAGELGTNLGHDGTEVTAAQDLHQRMLAGLFLAQTQ